MSESTRGSTVRDRFEALEISDRDWHSLTGIDRKTLHRAMSDDPKTRPQTYTAIEAELTRLERQREQARQAADHFKARRIAVGVSVSGLSRRAGLHRSGVTALEAGRGVRDTTLAAVDGTLRELEREHGVEAVEETEQTEQVEQVETKPPAIRFSVTGNDGVTLSVEGPVEVIAELEAAAERILRRMQASEAARAQS